MVLIPIPVIRSIGIGGLLIPLVSVCAAITFLPAMLSLLGRRINSVRVMPKRIVEGTDPRSGLLVALVAHSSCGARGPSRGHRRSRSSRC